MDFLSAFIVKYYSSTITIYKQSLSEEKVNKYNLYANQ